MNKIKIFQSDDAVRLEESITSWFNHHLDYDIADYQFTVDGGYMYAAIKLGESDAAKRKRLQEELHNMRVQPLTDDPWRGEFIPVGMPSSPPPTPFTIV